MSDGEKNLFQATTTPLVRNIFEQFFSKQLAGKATSAPKRHRCGVCEVCQLPDCGKCSHCKDMIKFGGSGRSKQACIHRRCPNMAIQVAEDDECTEVPEPEVAKKSGKKTRLEKVKTRVEWVGEPVKEGKKKMYSAVRIHDTEVSAMQVSSV